MPSRRMLAATLLATAAMTRIPVADVGYSTLDAGPDDGAHGGHGRHAVQQVVSRSSTGQPGR